MMNAEQENFSVARNPVTDEMVRGMDDMAGLLDEPAAKAEANQPTKEIT
ncbi:hypothetical protein QTI05_22615 [Variovorax sp. J22R193]|nr:hypothetical protein [Variovorax sp. J22R193]MDM0041851.1 hypothetical protein [Variovorax sp. J22R193]